MVTIRPITPDDAERWRELFHEYGIFYETTFTDDIKAGVWEWLTDPAHSVNGLVAADDDGKLVGFAHYRELPDTFTAGPSYYLNDLYVDPDARGGGVAAQLIERLGEIAHERGAVMVSWITGTDNTRAQGLYDRISRKTDWVTYEMDV